MNQPNTDRTKAYLSWSSGKDSAYALFEARRLGLADIVGLITTTNEAFDRVAMHGTRNALLDRQIAATGLPCLKVPLPWPCSNDEYESRMAKAMDEIAAQGVRHMVFGDLYLEDIRAYRNEKLAAIGMQAIYPLWGRETGALARSMIADGLVAHLVTVDPRKLDKSFAGRRFDASLLADLPADVDPCGENGEFHTAVVAGPMFDTAIDVRLGEVVERDGFVYADVIPA
ncbi:ATP-binding protein [Ferrovibrio sp.]|uniref:Dph6-related ATP pyrophosphatase n=1 Tax=Ferrovibrio sp. TaxID=1917215 RepID=UPI00345D8B8F|nr:adenine nucleotide alpha hydrolase [Ferrovibrio sp.]